MPKSIPFYAAYSTRVTSQNASGYYTRSSGRSKGVPFASGVLLRLLIWELHGDPKFSPMGNACKHTQCYYTRRV